MCAKLRRPQHAQRWSLQGGIAMMKIDGRDQADDDHDAGDKEDEDKDTGEKLQDNEVEVADDDGNVEVPCT